MDPRHSTAGPARDDWESHWDEFADSASENPAQRYRRALIARYLGRLEPPRRVLDIGSGQGDLLCSLRAELPDVELAGLELSTTGIERARQKVPGARFVQADLLRAPVDLPELTGWADVAICSEVLEHVEEPAVLLRNASRSVTAGGRVLITVPGGPRTAFDRHIGHRRHYDAASLRQVILDAGLTPELVRGHGFPSFNLYKLVVLARGERLIDDAAASGPPSPLAAATMRVFGALLQPRRCSSRAGWQLLAVAQVPHAYGGGPADPSSHAEVT